MNTRQRLDRWWRGRFGPLAAPERWLFVVGCYNSGTTLLHDLLAEHPAIGSLPTEGQFLTDQFVVPRDVGLARQWAIEPARFRLTEDDGASIDVERIKRQWGARFDDVSRPVLLERSPPDAARTRWLQRHFRPATFVGIVRDGYAVAEGIRRRAGHPLELAAHQWAAANEIMLADFAHLDRAMLVRYEELTERPDDVIAAVCAFTGLPEMPSSLTGRRFAVHDEHSTVRNMNGRSIAALSVDERAEIRRVAGPMLDELGYAAPDDR